MAPEVSRRCPSDKTRGCRSPSGRTLHRPRRMKRRSGIRGSSSAHSPSSECARGASTRKSTRRRSSVSRSNAGSRRRMSHGLNCVQERDTRSASGRQPQRLWHWTERVGTWTPPRLTPQHGRSSRAILSGRGRRLQIPKGSGSWRPLLHGLRRLPPTAARARACFGAVGANARYRKNQRDPPSTRPTPRSVRDVEGCSKYRKDRNADRCSADGQARDRMERGGGWTSRELVARG